MPLALLEGMRPFPSLLGLGFLSVLAFAACGEASSDGPSCEAPNLVGHKDSFWVRKPETTECVPVTRATAPPNTDTDFWMEFGSLIECQSITCRVGDTRAAGDGCNTCTCGGASAPNLEGGYWTCTNEACGSAVPTGKQCGFWQGACQAGEYCAFSPSDSCSDTDAPSICITQPSDCVHEAAPVPVCGCDGTSYANRCEAARAGTGIRAMGVCPRRADTVVACGAKAGDACTADEYCAYVAGDLCGAAGGDSAATDAKCLPRPSACLPIDAPVCGCDGQTYANACEAGRAGTGVFGEGPCCNR